MQDAEYGKLERKGPGKRAAGVPQGRMANLELLRCVAMMMVVVLHYLGKGGLLPELTGTDMDSTGLVAWLLECFCIVAVNVYMFLSGYLLCTSSFKPSRLVGLWFQVWVYSVAVGLLGALTGIVMETPVDTHYILTLLFPVSMSHYWFLTAYVFLYLLLPFMGIALRKMDRRQMQVAACCLLFAFCLLKSLLPARLEADQKGLDCLWYLCVFVAAAYMRRFGVSFLEKRGRGVFLYIGSCLAVFGGTFGLREIYLRTGSLELILKVFLEYNHILVFLAAAGLFAAFSRMQVSGWLSRLVNHIGPYTLGVYLLHENLGLRYTWQNWLGAERITSVWGLAAGVAIAVTCVFVCGVLVDMLRVLVLKGMDECLGKLRVYQGWKGWLRKADSWFAGDGNLV